MDETEKYQPIIDGEFRTDDSRWQNVASGFYCRRCAALLLVGDRYCPGCHWAFACLTIPLSATVNRPDLLAMMSRERRTIEEVNRAKKHALPPASVRATRTPAEPRQEGIAPDPNPKGWVWDALRGQWITEKQQQKEGENTLIFVVLALLLMLVLFAGLSSCGAH